MQRPEWITVNYNENSIATVSDYLVEHGINTVCEGALCPNRWTCYAHKEVTFMILGSNCTRRCMFCNVSKGIPDSVDEYEAERILSTVKWLGSDYAVITSVTRDDLSDGGAEQFVIAIELLNANDIDVEVLIPDFNGEDDPLKAIVDAGPKVIAYNMETVLDLYPVVRPLSNYATGLYVLDEIKRLNKKIVTKSGFMLGLGENLVQIKELIRNIKDTGCDILTIGQYLKPTESHMDVKTYVHPKMFKMLEEYAYKLGFGSVQAAPFARSSLNARNTFKNIK
ncbi:MAG: lipoyl synthase [Deltaproteobacteria bacterium]|nr:lipoyl synthase [Deltaproteobacteria bacterium]